MANNFKSNVTPFISTSASNVYVCQAATQTTVIGMSIANIIGTPITVSVSLHSGATTGFIVKDAPVPNGQSLIPIGGDQKMVLEAGDFIRVQSSDVNSADVIVSVLEIT